jgi:hypothetical protein
MNNPKRNIRQNRTNRNQQIETAKAEWFTEEEKLSNEKTDLGYKDFPWDAFMAIAPDDSIDIVKQSQIIDLQERYKKFTERQAIIWAEDNVIKEFNEKHAIVHVDQTYILTEKINTLGNKDFSLENRQSFKTYYEDETIVCIDDIERSKADIWLKSSKRRKYKGIIFDPTTTECTKEYYNLWKGFARTARQGDCSKYWDHVRDNICNDDQELYLYVRKWLAYVFQRPAEVHTALVLQGSQGTGKNSFVEPLGVLLGSHYKPLSSLTELISNFNYHLKNAVLIHANEALWGGHKKDLGTVKAMITEQTCLIEGKGKDRIVVKNFKHIILSSNEDWPVHLDPDDRRFLVIRISEQRKEDLEYFKRISEQLNCGGYEALLHDLLHEDLTNFNPRRMPSSADSFSIKMRSAESPHRYIYEVLCEGGFSISITSQDTKPVWQDVVSKDSVYADYTLWCERNGEESLSKALLGRAIKQVIVTTLDARPGVDTETGKKSRVRCYKLPSLRKAQEEFCKAFKEKPERIFDNYEEIQQAVQSRIASIV